ncbi:MAG: alpha/beta fold hydrolase [Acidimicrobiales bacterium]
MPQKYLTIGGTATLVHHRGATTLPGSPPKTEQGSTIVCLHEAGTNGGQFADLMDHLAEKHSPIAFDQPGHGRSAGLDALPSIDAMVDQLRSLTEAWSIDHPVLVGEGLGSVVALQASVSDAGHPAALVLIGGTASASDLDSEIAALAAITSGKARREFDRDGYAPETDKTVYQKAFGYWVKTDPRATLGARRAQAAWSLNAAPAVPTMIVVGEHEDADALAAAEALAQQLPNASVHRLDGAGRRGVLEQPAALAAAISAFIEANVTNNGSGSEQAAS